MRVVMQHARPTIEDPREHRTLTTGETYFVLGVSHEDYRLIDDRGEPVLFPKNIFEVVDRSIPAGWHLRDSDDGYDLEPPATGKPGVYERWFDSNGDPAATVRAQAVVRRMLEDMRATLDEIDRALVDRDLARLDAAVTRRAEPPVTRLPR